MLSKGLAHLRRQWIGALALFLLLSGGTAVALDGHNSVFSDDIAPGEVRSKGSVGGEATRLLARGRPGRVR